MKMTTADNREATPGRSLTGTINNTFSQRVQRVIGAMFNYNLRQRYEAFIVNYRDCELYC
jgi:hypothetical protein